MIRPSYVHEKLSRAVDTLVTHPGPIHERLTSAAVGYLSSLEEDHFPDGEIKDIWLEMWAAFTKEESEDPDEGRIHASVRAMSTSEATEHAQMILALMHQTEDWTGKLDLPD